MTVNEILYLRIGILEDHHVISKIAADYTRQIIAMLMEKYPEIPLDKGEMFFTHLAMASERACHDIEENPIDKTVLDTVKLEPVYPKALKIRDEMLSKTTIVFSETEKDFLSVHLCNLFL